MATSAGGHERALADRGLRKALGAYYTPPDVVDGLLHLALDPLLDVCLADPTDPVAAVSALRVLDPSCGTGNFLIAAVERISAALAGLGLASPDAAEVAVRCVRGIELDAATARVCRAGLRERHPSGGGRTIVRGDALLGGRLVPAGGFDLVIGNPPFLSQLASSSSRTPPETEALRRRFGPAVGAYTDPASIFLLAALQAARPAGGVVCLIEPVAVLSAHDARGVRSAALADAALRALWVAEQPVFDADVEVCAPVLVRERTTATTTGTTTGTGTATTTGTTTTTTTRLIRGRSFAWGPAVAMPRASSSSWSSLLAALQDLPERNFATSGVLGDLADATADFRDQYYGLTGAVSDLVTGAADRPRLVTSGLIDPARLLWGDRTCRFNKVSYLHPRVELDRLAPPLRKWAGRRLVPKVLLATQTRVLEAIVDADGDLLPSVPVVTITARAPGPDDLWRIAALLCSPPVTLVAARRHLGAARNATALRLSASDVLALPLPVDHDAWGRGTARFAAASVAEDGSRRSAELAASARAMLEAYGLPSDDDLLGWWASRLPQGRND